MNKHAKMAYDFSGDAAKAALDILLAALPVALLYSVVLVVLCVVAIVFMHKRRLYTREARLWNVLAKMHYPLWLLLFASFGFAFGFIASIKSSCDKVIDEDLHPALAGMVAPIQEQIIGSLPTELAEGEMTGKAMYDYLIEKAAEHSMFAEQQDAEGMFFELGRQIEKAVRQQVAKFVLDQAIVAAGEQAGLTGEQAEFSVEVFKSIDFSKKADEIAGKVTGAAKKQVSGFANGMRLQVLIYAVILLALLFIEPVVYYKLVLPKRAKALALAKEQVPTPEVVE